jgi:2'-5' RNA ligase
MHGIVSLLDESANQQVRQLWDELHHRFGIQQLVERVPFPHFSYQVAADYQEDELDDALRTFAADHQPFTVTTAGLGIFAGSQPVLVTTVVRSPDLSHVHRELWQAVDGIGSGVNDLYRPARWMPHITLAHFDLTPPLLGEVVAVLADRDFQWTISIDNVAVIWDTGKPHELGYRFPLGEPEDH